MAFSKTMTLESRIQGSARPSKDRQSERRSIKQSSPFLYLINQNLFENQSEIIRQYLEMGVPLGKAGEERPHTVSGIYLKVDDAPAFVRLMEEKRYVTNNIDLTHMEDWRETLTRNLPQWSKRHDGAILFDRHNGNGTHKDHPSDHVSSYIIFDGLCNSVLCGFLAERIKFMDRKNDCEVANRIAKDELDRFHLYNVNAFDIRQAGLWHDNLYDSMGMNGINLVQRVYERLCQEKGYRDMDNRKINSFEDLLTYISPANFSFMNEKSKELRYMGAKSRNSLALALRFPQVTVYCLKDSIYGPQNGPTTGTGKFIAIKFDPTKSMLNWYEAYNILATDPEYLEKYLPEGLMDHFDAEKNTLMQFTDRRGKRQSIATVLEVYQDNIYEKRELPRVAATFLEKNPSADAASLQRIVYPHGIQVHYDSLRNGGDVTIEDSLRRL